MHNRQPTTANPIITDSINEAFGAFVVGLELADGLAVEEGLNEGTAVVSGAGEGAREVEGLGDGLRLGDDVSEGEKLGL